MPEHGRRARLVRVARPRCQRRDPTLGHDADRSCKRVRHHGTPQRPHWHHAEHGCSGRGQRAANSYVLAGFVRRHDPPRALRRDGAEPRPGPRARGRRPVLLLQLGLDALALVYVRVLEHAGLCRTGAAHRAELLCVGDEVPRPQQQRQARRRRAGIAPLGDLGRLQRQRRARCQRAVRDHRQPRPVRDQRHPPARRHVHVAGDAAHGESSEASPRRRGDLHVSERRHAGRHRLGARRHVPVRMAGEHRGHDLRSQPRLRQLPAA